MSCENLYNCKHYRSLEKKCKILKRKINLSDCHSCADFDLKEVKPSKSTNKDKCLRMSLKKPLKRVSSKRAKLEKNRYSIFTKDLKHCYFHKDREEDDLHEIFRGSKRLISMKWGMVLPLCRECHNNEELAKKWTIIGQKAFMKYYNKTEDEFRKIFGRNYL